MKRKKAFSTILAAATAAATLTTTCIPAFAGNWEAPTSPIAVSSTTSDANGNATDNIIQTAGHRAAQTLVEILGLDNRACQNMAGNADGLADGATDQEDPHNRTDVSVLEAGNDCKILGVFGSDFNSNPDPYYYNYYYNLYATVNNLTLSEDYIYCIADSLSPNLADTVTYTTLEDGTGVSASVYARPEILIGTGANKYNSDTYAEYIAALQESSDVYDDYNPYIFNYKYNTVYQEGESLQRLAAAMNQITEGTLYGSINENQLVQSSDDDSSVGEVGRYGDPSTIANDYMLYVKGLSAYVYKNVIETEGDLKTAVVIDALSMAEDEDIGDGYFRAYDNTTPTGLAKYARGAEAIENITVNLATEYADDGSGKSTVYQNSSDGKAYKISADVVAEAEVIVLQGVQSDYGTITKDEFIELMAEQGYDVSDKIIIDSNPQVVYGLTCNSVESGMAYGYYMGFIYPEILDPVDAMAFFDYTIFHITDIDSLQSIIDFQAESAVEDLEDSSTALSENWGSDIAAAIQEGVEYYNSLSEEEQSVFYFSTAGSSITTTDDDGNTIVTAYTAEGGIFTSYDEENNNTVLDESTEYPTATAEEDTEETGDEETGDEETGDEETGDVDETGDEETGDEETGGEETGGEETGDEETGDVDETGDEETGGEETGSTDDSGSTESGTTDGTSDTTDDTGATEETGTTEDTSGTGETTDTSGTTDGTSGTTNTSTTDITTTTPTALTAQTITVKAKTTKKFKATKLKKKKATFKITASTNGDGKVTFAKKSGSAKLKISKKGKVTVKKGTYKKGKTLKMKVTVTAAATSTYSEATETITVKVKVK